MFKIITALIDKISPPRAVITLPKLIDLESNIFPCVFAPFNGENIGFILKELNEIEIRECGNFSLIECLTNTVDERNITVDQMVEFSEIQHNICMASMVSPSYNEVIEMYDKTESVKKAKEQLKEIELKLIQAEIEGITKEYKELHSKFSTCKILSNLVLPNDFTSFVFAYAVGLDKSDIKKLNYEILLNAAILAEKGHDNPSDHISGRFSDFNKTDINNRAWHVLYKERELNNGG